MRVLWLHPSPMLQAGIIVFGHDHLFVTSHIGRCHHLAMVLHPFLACGMVDRSLVCSCTGIEQHSVGLPNIVGDVSA
jgi:hypothetical protein